MRVGAVLVVVVLVLLVGVVGRVADDHADLAAVLTLDPLDVLVAQAAEQVELVACMDAQRVDVVERIDQAQVLEFGELPGDRLIGRLDVQVGDVVGQDRRLRWRAALPCICGAACRRGRGSFRAVRR